MKLPKFAGAPVSLQPPFQFQNVMVNVFPLRAQLDTLQRFCDSFINELIPPEVGHFRAPLPYVMLMLLDYGKLAAQRTNFGCFSQREVFFSVPLEWYQPFGGRWVFQDWVAITPFMYVDSEMSMTLGRSAMGWPKSKANLQPKLTGWMQDPTGAMVDVALSAPVLTKAYAGAKMEEQPLMLIRSLGGASTQIPFDGEGPLTPWTMWSTLAKSALAFQSDFFSSLQGMGLWPAHAGSTRQNLARKARRSVELGSQALPWGPTLTSNTINLKQFRLADRPQDYCYQGLTSSPLRFTSFTRGGPLGSALRGPSGGYTVDLNCWPTFPVVEALGLKAQRLPSASGPDVARLTPVFPYWYEASMEYERTKTLAWRTHDTPWCDDSGRRIGSGEAAPLGTRYFNTATGAADPVRTGPFKFPSASLTVFPLLAKRDALRKLVDEVLNRGGCHRPFEVWGEAKDDYAYVYLAALDGQVVSETNNIGDWGELSLTFYVPVGVSSPGSAPVGGLFPAFTFAKGSTQACTLSELYGVPAIEAQFERPDNDWADTGGRELRTLLRLRAESLPTLHEGQRAGLHTLLELHDRGAGAVQDYEGLSDTGEDFCRLMRREVERKSQVFPADKLLGRALALDFLAAGAPLYVYTLKQFRDAGEPEKACYQSLVEIPYSIDAVGSLEELERLSSVEVHSSASFPIVDTLGLVARDRRSEAGAVVHSLEAVRPFRLRADLSLGNGREFDVERFGLRKHWKERDGSRRRREGAVVSVPLLPTAPAWLTEREQYINEHPCHLKRTIAEWQSKHPEEAISTQPPTRMAARDVPPPPWVEPQIVLESILSLEWEDRSGASVRASVRQTLERKSQTESSFKRDESKELLKKAVELLAEQPTHKRSEVVTKVDEKVAKEVASVFMRDRKPDHCVLRASAMRERDTLFPLDQCWNQLWWDGAEHPSQS